MNWLKKFLFPLFIAEDSGGIGTVNDLESLQDEKSEEDDKGAGDEKAEGAEKGGKKDTGEDDEGEDKESEDEDKLEESDEEELEEETEEETEEEKEESEEKELDLVTRAADIKKTYPDFFKKFPDVRAAIYRDVQFSQFFASPEDAKQASERSDILGKIEDDIINNGNPDKLLKVVADTNKESFEKLSLRLLPYLQKEHKELYYEAAAVPIKQLLRAAYREGNGKYGDLGRAALYIHRYFFGDLNLDSKVKGESEVREEKESEEKKQYRQRLAEIDAREMENFSKSVDASYISRMSKLIREGLDKDERLTEYSKAKLVEDILRGIRKQLESDSRYIGQMKSLFNQAKNSNYSNDLKSRILNTSLARAKSLVPSLRSQLVSEALGQKNRNGKVKEKEAAEKKEERREERRETKREHYTREVEKPKKQLTDLDILRAR